MVVNRRQLTSFKKLHFLFHLEVEVFLLSLDYGFELLSSVVDLLVVLKGVVDERIYGLLVEQGVVLSATTMLH